MKEIQLELTWPHCSKVGCMEEATRWRAVGERTIFFACEPHAAHYQRIMSALFRPLPSPMAWPAGWEPLLLRRKPCGLIRAGSTVEVAHAFD